MTRIQLVTIKYPQTPDRINNNLRCKLEIWNWEILAWIIQGRKEQPFWKPLHSKTSRPVKILNRRSHWGLMVSGCISLHAWCTQQGLGRSISPRWRWHYNKAKPGWIFGRIGAWFNRILALVHEVIDFHSLLIFVWWVCDALARSLANFCSVPPKKLLNCNE